MIDESENTFLSKEDITKELLKLFLGTERSKSQSCQALEKVIKDHMPRLKKSLPRVEVEEYNPLMCIEAGELRAMGIQIPDNIPDCAWTERWSIQWNSAEVKEKEGIVSCGITFTRPFRWISINLPKEFLVP
jgi:hypothetical protein